MASIKEAEKIHSSKFNGIQNEDIKSIVSQKTQMSFTDDEFVRNDKKKF